MLNIFKIIIPVLALLIFSTVLSANDFEKYNKSSKVNTKNSTNKGRSLEGKNKSDLAVQSRSKSDSKVQPKERTSSIRSKRY